MATDLEIIDGVFDAMTAEDLETPAETVSPAHGSNLIALTPEIVNWVFVRLRNGRTPREIKDYIKANHPQKKGISWGQLRLIMQRRREIYQQKVAAQTPVEE